MILVFAALLSSASASPLPLKDAIHQAVSANPRLKAARFEKDASTQTVEVRKARYYPALDAAAVASTGSPGSFSLFDVDSDISSSQRLGYGGALVLKQNLWDFGRTMDSVHTAEAQSTFQDKQFRLTELDVVREVLRTYLDCSFLSARIGDAREMAAEAHVIARETSKFVRSGQRSIVERYLVDAEAKEAETRVAEFSERLNVTEERLALELGRDSGKVQCTELAQIGKALSGWQTSGASNPVIDAQTARVEIARSKWNEARADSRPELYAMATGGYFENTALKDKWNYAAGVGLKFPLFEGFRIDSNIHQEEDHWLGEQAALDSTKQGLAVTNAKFDEQIRALQIRLKLLREETTLARQVFSLARKRYMSLQGTMIDLKESIRNLNRVLQSSDEAYHDLYAALGERALLNGAEF